MSSRYIGIVRRVVEWIEKWISVDTCNYCQPHVFKNCEVKVGYLVAGTIVERYAVHQILAVPLGNIVPEMIVLLSILKRGDRDWPSVDGFA